MKRANNLFDSILDRENLRIALHKASKGKRERPDARAFIADQEGHLYRMARDVRAGVFPLGRCQWFTIHDPKRRIITAPCFSERVLHHAIMNVCEPHFERFLIADTFACRRGKGRIAALHRAMHFSGRYGYAVKLDMRKYFDSIAHDLLLDRLRRRFKDRQLLALFERIVNSHMVSAGRGLPIGSLTSQHFANFYLGWFDRFVKETLRVYGYVRYMDDCILWSENKPQLYEWVHACLLFLRSELSLTPKESHAITVVRHGLEMLGCRVYPSHMKLNRRSRHRFRRKLIDLEAEFKGEAVSAIDYQPMLTSLLAFTQAGGVKSWRFRHELLRKLMVSGFWARTG